MAELEEFIVVRRHIGDRAYDRGETRTALFADVKHLCPHVLQPLAEKADGPLDNKAEGAVPADKAVKGRKARTKAQKAEEGEDK